MVHSRLVQITLAVFALTLYACTERNPTYIAEDGGTTCSDPCVVGKTTCLGDQIQLCQLIEGCGHWSDPQPCPPDEPYCSEGACSSTCEDECEEGERRCFGLGFQRCGQADSDPCRDWGPVIVCDAGERCAEGICVADPCEERECGVVDGASCGECGVGWLCNTEGRCYDPCEGKECGIFGEVSCGKCTNGTLCQPSTGTCTNGTEGYAQIEAGTFQMGSPASESCRDSAEAQHHVTLTNAFELQRTEVTQAQFEALMAYNPSNFGQSAESADCTDCPVETVSWHEAAAYCNALSAQAGLSTCYQCSGSNVSVLCDVKSAFAGATIYNCPGYRLPTEAEWEYAYRAGTMTPYYNGTNDSTMCNECSSIEAKLGSIAWYCANTDTVHSVAQKTPNAWGLHDMAGNVWEWCHDWYDTTSTGRMTDPAGAATGTTRVVRGAGWANEPHYLRAALRDYEEPAKGYTDLGFRCARGK
ncbi:MAG: formylglycine-generating enzyme family protein [Deltaproteobacteria bacterium]|nr:formylglycine-generating enzyme family protein [Deltaproteobacteria bacterium]